MRRPVLVVVALLGVLVAAVGAWSALHPLAFSSGWTAYSPLSANAPAPVFGPPWWSLALIAIGSALAGAAFTLRLALIRGRR